MEIATLILIICAGLYYFLVLNPKNIGKRGKDSNSSNEFVNIRDINEDFLYTLDGYIMKYIRIYPISLELLSDREKEVLTLGISNELSQLDNLDFKFIAVSRPVDISPIIDEHQKKLTESVDKYQRELLRKEIMELSVYATSGEVVERQFFFCLWDTEKRKREFSERVEKFAKAFTSNRIKVEILDKRGMIRFANMVNHPQYVHLEEINPENVVTTLIQHRRVS